MVEKFQTAFPEDTLPEPDEVLCRFGCGRPGLYFGDGPRGKELPRCDRQISNCPVTRGTALRAVRRKRLPSLYR